MVLTSINTTEFAVFAPLQGEQGENYSKGEVVISNIPRDQSAVQLAITTPVDRPRQKPIIVVTTSLVNRGNWKMKAVAVFDMLGITFDDAKSEAILRELFKLTGTVFHPIIRQDVEKRTLFVEFTGQAFNDDQFTTSVDTAKSIIASLDEFLESLQDPCKAECPTQLTDPDDCP